MLPEGRLTLVGEQEASMARVVPHIFRDEILGDRFEWHVANFDKEAKKPQILHRTRAFDASFRAFRDANPTLTVPEALHAWTRTQLKPATKDARNGSSEPFPGSTSAQRPFRPSGSGARSRRAARRTRSSGFRSCRRATVRLTASSGPRIRSPIPIAWTPLPGG